MRDPGNAVVWIGSSDSVPGNTADPSWLDPLSPQHQMMSLTAMAHVGLAPAAIRPVGSIAEIDRFARTCTEEGTTRTTHAVIKITHTEPVRNRSRTCS
jgi:hypothetical protein